MATNGLAELASAVDLHTTADGPYNTAVPALGLSRLSAPSDCTALVYEPSLCVAAQGAKEVCLADETFRLDPARSLLVSVDLPVSVRVAEVSRFPPSRKMWLTQARTERTTSPVVSHPGYIIISPCHDT